MKRFLAWLRKHQINQLKEDIYAIDAEIRADAQAGYVCAYTHAKRARYQYRLAGLLNTDPPEWKL